MKNLFQLTGSIAIAVTLTHTVHAQVGRSQGLLDANVITEKELAAPPHINADLAKQIVASSGRSPTSPT